MPKGEEPTLVGGPRKRFVVGHRKSEWKRCVGGGADHTSRKTVDQTRFAQASLSKVLLSFHDGSNNAMRAIATPDRKVDRSGYSKSKTGYLKST